MANAPEETAAMVEPDDILGSSVVLSSLDRIAHLLGGGPIWWGQTHDTDETHLDWGSGRIDGPNQRQRSSNESPASSRMSHWRPELRAAAQRSTQHRTWHLAHAVTSLGLYKIDLTNDQK